MTGTPHFLKRKNNFFAFPLLLIFSPAYFEGVGNLFPKVSKRRK